MQAAGRLLATAVLAAGLALPAFGRTVLELDAAHQPVPLLDWGDAWIDESGQATVEQVATSVRISWMPTAADAIYPLTTGKNLWVRFTVPPAPDVERWYLEIPYSGVNRVTLYTQDSSDRWIPQEAGDALPVTEWPVPHRHPLLPLSVSAEVPRTYLLRVQNAHSFGAPLNFISESYFSYHGQQASLVLGIYFGLAALAAIMAAISAVSLRDSAYGWYALTVTLMGLTQGGLTGIDGLHLWPRLPWWNDVSALLLPVLATAALVRFVAVTASLPERSRQLELLFGAVSLAGVAVGAAIMLVDASHRFMLMVSYIVAAVTVAISGTLWSVSRGDRYARWLVGGMLPVVVGAAFPLARTAGLIPVSFWATHAMQIGIACELPVLLIILMLRSQHRRENRRRLQGLDRIDPATGLINGHVFTERLVQMIARSTRLKYRSAVLLIDIINIEQIRRDFDRRAADELPLRVAGRLLSTAREIDSVARLSEHRFGLLLEGPLTAEEVAEAGPRAVARCLMPFRNKPLEWVAQVRVAQALVPMHGTNADAVIDQLEVLLASVPPESKRAVFMLGRTAPAAPPTTPAALTH